MKILDAANRLIHGYLIFVRKNQSPLQTPQNKSSRASGNRSFDFLQPVNDLQGILRSSLKTGIVKGVVRPW